MWKSNKEHRKVRDRIRFDGNGKQLVENLSGKENMQCLELLPYTIITSLDCGDAWRVFVTD
jgi:hypothetical protein